MLDRMHGAKVTCDELKTFYNSAFKMSSRCYLVNQLLTTVQSAPQLKMNIHGSLWHFAGSR
jgi:hypothetical protein